MDETQEPQRIASPALSDLLPCPLCGGAAVYDKVEVDNGQYIRCSHCNVSTALHYGRCENLLNAWNRRAG